MKEENFLIFEIEEVDNILAEQMKKITFDKIEDFIENQLINREFETNIADMFNLYRTCIQNRTRQVDTKKVIFNWLNEINLVTFIMF